MNTALLLVDIQNDYFPGGKMELEGIVRGRRWAAVLSSITFARPAPLVHVRHLSERPGATFLLPGTEGAGIHPSVAPRALRDRDREELAERLPEHTPPRSSEGRTDRSARRRRHDDPHVHRRHRAGGLGSRLPVLGRAGTPAPARALAFEGTAVAAQAVQAAFLAGLRAAYAEVLTTAEILAPARTGPDRLPPRRAGARGDSSC